MGEELPWLSVDMSMLAFYNIVTARVAGAGGLDQAIEPANFRGVKAEDLEIMCVRRAHAHMSGALCFKNKTKSHRHFRIYLCQVTSESFQLL